MIGCNGAGRPRFSCVEEGLSRMRCATDCEGRDEHSWPRHTEIRTVAGKIEGLKYQFGSTIVNEMGNVRHSLGNPTFS